jgi:hypothetical protein
MVLIKEDRKVKVRLRGGYSCKIGQEEYHGGELGIEITIPESEVNARPNLYEPIDAPKAVKQEPKPDPVLMKHKPSVIEAIKEQTEPEKEKESEKEEPEKEKEESEMDKKNKKSETTEKKNIDVPVKDRMIKNKDTKKK